MNDVIRFHGGTLVPLPCSQILAGAQRHDFEDVVVMGRLKNGETYLSGSTSDLGLWLYLVEKLKKELI